MRIGIISDVHSNYIALKEVLEFLEGKIDSLVCSGDIVGYGPQPRECIEALMDFQLKTFYCLGNHDLGVRFSYSNKICEPLKQDYNFMTKFPFREAAAEMLDQNASVIDTDHFSFLKSLIHKQIFNLNDNKIYLTHGSPSRKGHENIGDYFKLPSFQMKSSIRKKLKRDKEATTADFIILGHTHHRFLISPNSDFSWSLMSKKFTLKRVKFPIKFPVDEGRFILNPGSVGQPRDGTGNSSFAILDLEERMVEFFDLKYPHEELYKLTKKVCVPSLQDASFWSIVF